MIRKIILIDEEKCNGCGLCAKACHEGAIDLVNGKAKLARENFCDGLGDCLPGCPTGAITFEEREAPDYDEAAVMAAKEKKKAAGPKVISGMASGLSSALAAGASRIMKTPNLMASPAASKNSTSMMEAEPLPNWPIQIKLAPLKSPAFAGASLLIAADCTGYAYANFHQDFVQGHVVLIGCPKLDGVNYAEKLTEIFRNNSFTDITLTRMTVPCCGGMVVAVKKALQASGRNIPLNIVTIGIDGKIIPG